MHAVFNPSFNALATAMATARHRASNVLEIARDRHVEQAPWRVYITVSGIHLISILRG